MLQYSPELEFTVSLSPLFYHFFQNNYVKLILLLKYYSIFPELDEYDFNAAAVPSDLSKRQQLFFSKTEPSEDFDVILIIIIITID